jgi:hypothetical protein
MSTPITFIPLREDTSTVPPPFCLRMTDQATPRSLFVIDDAKQLGVLAQFRELRLHDRHAEFPRHVLNRQLREPNDVHAQLTAGEPQRLDDLVLPAAELNHATADGGPGARGHG